VIGSVMGGRECIAGRPVPDLGLHRGRVMETYTPAPEEALDRRRTEAEEAQRPTRVPADKATPELPAGEEPVTPYDHLWFERRPLS
jgi:hypothetical protein